MTSYFMSTETAQNNNAIDDDDDDGGDDDIVGEMWFNELSFGLLLKRENENFTVFVCVFKCATREQNWLAYLITYS